MDIIGTPQKTRRQNANTNKAELKRLGLNKQASQIAVGYKDEESGDYPIYLFGDGTLMLNFPNQASIFLDRAETVRLYSFFDLGHVKEMMIAVLRASLVEAGHEDLIDQLMAMPDDHKQAVLWAFGRAEKPAFLDQPAA